MRWRLLLVFTLFLVSCTAEQENKDEKVVIPEDSIASADFIEAEVGAGDTIERPEMEENDSTADYEQTFIDSGLINLEEFIPGILVDLKYSTTDNFLSTDVYGKLTKAYLRPIAAEKLKKAQEFLQSEHPEYTLLVYDGARPNRVQWTMWEVLDIPFKKNYLAPPWEGSLHNYGCAVDLTIADAAGKALDMGTKFDFFGPEAQPQLEARMLKEGKLTQEQIDNRHLLKKVMEKAGFWGIQTEWWHFNAVGNKMVREKYPIIP